MPGRVIPYRTPFFLPWLYPNLLWRMPAEGNALYLTFDDGPVPGPTEYVLDVLRERKAHATFFCIGDNVRKHPDIFQRIMREGHSIGNHTYNHLDGWKTSADEYIANVVAFDEASAFAGKPSRVDLFRPPYGTITRRQIRMLRHDYRIVMWDVLTRDYETGMTREACLRGSLRATRPGSLIVFHDSHKAWPNMKYALPRLMDHFLQKGFVFKALL